jgi:CRISPR-associated protein Csc2
MIDNEVNSYWSLFVRRGKHWACSTSLMFHRSKGKMIQIVLLRETRSYAIFTTEGAVLDTERLQAGIKARDSLSRVVMFKRKQIAAERRRGKELLREYGVVPVEDAVPVDGTLSEQKKGKEAGPTACRLMDGVCGRCPDCVLYGFAAVKDEGSQRSRVLTDSAWSVRDYQAIQKYIKLNAIDETVAGGVAGSAFTQRDHLLPQVFLLLRKKTREQLEQGYLSLADFQAHRKQC